MHVHEQLTRELREGERTLQTSTIILGMETSILFYRHEMMYNVLENVQRNARAVIGQNEFIIFP